MPPALSAKPFPYRFWTATAIVIAGFLFFVVGLKYAWGRLDITVSRPELVLGEIRGSFKIDRDLNGIFSKGLGGACLIGDFAHLMSDEDAFDKGVVKTPCTLKGHCNPYLQPGEKAGLNSGQQWEGYCIAGQNGQGKCWYKPWDGPDEGLVCETSGLHPTTPFKPGGTPWPVPSRWQVPDKEGEFVAQRFYNRYTNGRPAQWRVSGRLIGTQTVKNVFGEPACIATGGEKCL